MSWTTTAIWIALGLAASALAAPADASDLTPPEETVATGSGEAPTPEPGEGGETLSAGRAGPQGDSGPVSEGRCAPPDDRRPHGEVWGAVGTHDYRAGGVAMTVPVGDCATLGIAISGGKGGYGYGPYGAAPYLETDPRRAGRPPLLSGPDSLAPRPQR